MIVQAQQENSDNGIEEKQIIAMRRSQIIAEEKRMKIEDDIKHLNEEYLASLQSISQETERVLSENETAEIRARIAVLSNEISEKAAMIENATFEKQDLDRTLDRLQKA